MGSEYLNLEPAPRTLSVHFDYTGVPRLPQINPLPSPARLSRFPSPVKELADGRGQLLVFELLQEKLGEVAHGLGPGAGLEGVPDGPCLEVQGLAAADGAAQAKAAQVAYFVLLGCLPPHLA